MLPSPQTQSIKEKPYCNKFNKTLKNEPHKKKKRYLKQKTKPKMMYLGSDRDGAQDPVSLQTLVPVIFP